MLIKSLLASLAFILLSSCGYRWQDDISHEKRPTVSLPYVEGDENGFLTAEIIKALGSSGRVDVVSSCGDYRLEISVIGSASETVGYSINAQKVDGKVRNNLLAAEGRDTSTVVASLFCGKECISGPFYLSADADYDYVDGDSIQDLTFTNVAGRLVTVLPFSLGQLQPKEAAQEAAKNFLYVKLAQKIVDSVILDSGFVYKNALKN